MTAALENHMVFADPGLDADEAAEAARADDEARAEALDRDVDAFTDWLAAECAGHHDERCGYVSPASRDFNGLTTARVVSLLLYPASKLAGDAAWELRNRYLQSKGVRP